MKLIRPSYEIIEQGSGLQGIYDIIEKCGKTSYKSEAKGGEVAQRFVEARTKERHGAVLEFGTVYLKIPDIDKDGDGYDHFYEDNQYSRIGDVILEEDSVLYYHITTNYRVLVENNRLDDLKYLCEPTEYHEKRYCVKFITDIGVGREFLRHRVMSMVQESTRYIDLTKEKHGGECTFVIPSWISENELKEGKNISFWDNDWVDMSENKVVHYGPAALQCDPINSWLSALSYASFKYEELINNGWSAQEARGVLPLSTKTEFVLCGFKDDWVHFFQLRSDIAATGKPHPQSQELANPLRDEFIKREFMTKQDLEI